MSPQQQSAPPSPAPPPTRAQAYVLAITWFPGFCELLPAVPECRHPTAYQTSHFALHGLWPAGEYCGVSDALRSTDLAGRWDRLPAIELTDPTWTRLRGEMPGTRSHLERHEWIAHGSCSGATAEVFFRRAAELVAAINDSPVRDLFEINIGLDLTREQVRTAFDKAFGSGTGKRVRLGCENLDGHRTIDELTINLYGDAMGGDPLKTLIAAARTRGSGCDAGLVDR